MERVAVFLAMASLLLLAALAYAAGIVVSSQYPVAQSGDTYRVTLSVQGGREYRVYSLHVYSPTAVRLHVEPRGVGETRIEPPPVGGILAPGDYAVLFRANKGYSGPVTVVLEVVSPGVPPLVVALVGLGTAAAVLSRSEVRERLREGVYRLAAGLVYLIYRPEEALEHSLRASIYEYLRENGGASVSRLAKHLGAYQNAVSWHLQVLERFGYVGHSRIGRWTVYYYKGHMVEDWLSGFLASETRWGARAGRDALREKIRASRHEIEALLERNALNASRLRKLLGV